MKLIGGIFRIQGIGTEIGNIDMSSMLKNSRLFVGGALTVMALGLVVSSPTATYAAGSGGSGSSTTTTPTCKNKKIWDKRKLKCVKPKKSSGLSDDNLFEAARDLAYNKRYEEAITTLKLASNQQDPRILNYLGYSNRKLGRVEEGMVYYTAALKIDPDYTLVREYMGEAFLQLGDVDKARGQLAEIEKRCGVECREYVLLKTEIDKFVSR